MKKHKEPTWTSLVEAALRAADDFMTTEMLCAKTGGSVNQVSAACFFLRQRNVIGVEIAPSGRAWWYARPPEDDARIRHVLGRTPEAKPRKLRKTKEKHNAKAPETMH